MTHKLVKDVNDETWRKFIAYCKLKNIKVGEQMEEILNDFLNKKLKKLLK